MLIMNDLLDRIARFEYMAAADPTNDMALFSLGSAYFDAERYKEAAQSFETCVNLNPDMTRALELGGSALLKLDQNEDAKALLDKGYVLAASRGEKRVQDGIEVILKEGGFEVPKIESGDQAQQTGKQMDDAPLPGNIGEWILENVNQDQWNLWIGQGTKVINELRLDFSREEDQKVFEDYMIEFLGVPPDVVKLDRNSKE